MWFVKKLVFISGCGWFCNKRVDVFFPNKLINGCGLWVRLVLISGCGWFCNKRAQLGLISGCGFQ